MRLVIFEDGKFEQLYPISLTRAVFELRTGISSLLEKIEDNFAHDGVSLFVRDYLEMTVKKRNPSVSVNDINSISNSDILLVNGRCFFAGEKFKVTEQDCYVEIGGDLALAKINRKTLSEFKGTNIEQLVKFASLKLRQINADIKMINFPWDLVNYNTNTITDDFNKVKKCGIEGTFAKESVICGPKDQIYVGKNAVVHPFVCIETHHGPVFIDDEAEIHPYTRIEGPCYIGKKTIIYGAKIREGCSIGPVCRVGGEIEESIFHAYSNKYHEGFIGHSYIGEWVNLGALTTNSDLKNDYSNVSVVLGGKMIDTGSSKVGCFIGDHTKTSIGTLINTGSNIGAICLVLFSGSFLPKYLPSGSWFIRNTITKGSGLNRFIETTDRVMARRNMQFTAEDKDLMEKVYEITAPEREALLNKVI